MYQLKITNAHYLIVLDALYTHLIQPIIDKWDFKKVIWTNLVDLASGFSALKKFIGKKIQKIPNSIVVHPNAVNFMDLLKTPLNVPHVEINAENNTATLLTTGGTTGFPKAANLTHIT